jgi:hypothetical protein
MQACAPPQQSAPHWLPAGQAPQRPSPSQNVPGTQVPQAPPHPSGPHWRSPQLGWQPPPSRLRPPPSGISNRASVVGVKQPPSPHAAKSTR